MLEPIYLDLTSKMKNRGRRSGVGRKAIGGCDSSSNDKGVRKSKVQKWRKGDSCVSNPNVKTHRQTARHRARGFTNSLNSVLSQKLLAQHNAGFGESSIELDDDIQSCGSKSVVSSIASNCTNATFNKILGRIVTSQSSLNTQILAIVGAVTDTIHSSDGEQTDAACCATLLSLLKSTSEPLNSDQKTAALHLMSLLLRRVPKSILQVKSKEILNALNNNTADECEQQSLMKSLLGCWTLCLRAQTQSSWDSVLIRDTYAKILSATVCIKPKIRKAAQHAIGAILRGSVFMVTDHAPPFHPAANDTSAFCKSCLETMKAAGNKKGISHVLVLLQDVLSAFSTSGIKSTCDQVLSVLGSTDMVLKKGAFVTMENLFSMSPKPENLTADLNCKIINALLTLEPASDPDVMTYWLRAMEKAYCNLSRIHKKPANVDALMDKMVTLMEKNPDDKVFNSFMVVGSLYPSSLKKILPRLDALYLSKGYSKKGEIEKAMGIAVHKLGPREVLNILPLKISGDSDKDGDFPRSWLIPVFRDHVQETELGFFVEYFLPLASKINETCKSLAQRNNTSRSMAYSALLQQIWALLPSFCNRPTDLVTSFPSIAKIIGKTIESKSDIAAEVLNALRKLINQNLENGTEKSVLCRYAKNFIPIFCQICSAKNEKNPRDGDDAFRLSVLETLKCYLKISPEQLILTTFEKCLKKLNEEEERLMCLEKEEEMRKQNSKPKELEKIQEEKDCLESWCCLMDLCIAIVPRVPIVSLEPVKANLSRNLQSSNNSVQKKSYRLLEVCPGEFIIEHLALLTTFRSDSSMPVKVANPSSQAPRLRCLSNIIQMLDTPQVEFIGLLVPEVILCTKSTSEKARNAAFDLLVMMGQKYISWAPDKAPQEMVQRYFELFLMGLRVNDPHVVSCTVLALARVLFHFKGETTDEVIGSVCDIACLLLGHHSREIVQSALSLVHVLMSGFGDIMSGKFLPNLISGLSLLKNVSSYRKKIKDILRKLLKKCGFDIVSGMLPDVYVKVIKNIMKSEKKKKKTTGKDEIAPRKRTSDETFLEEMDDDDDESDDEDTFSKSNPKVWIKEDDDVLDFMDASASQKITTTKPKSRSRRENKDGFKVAKDGRLIIGDEDDVDNKKVDSSNASKKRKVDEVEEAMDVDDTDTKSTFSYQAGGRGIHRPINKKLKADENKNKSKKTKEDGKYNYSYIKLNPSNKRNKHETTKKLKHLFKKRTN